MVAVGPTSEYNRESVVDYMTSGRSDRKVAEPPPEIENLFKEHCQLIYRTAYGITRDYGDADDVFFDPRRNRIYVSCGAGEVAVAERSKAGWEISAYGDNLTNEKYFQEVVPLLGFFTVNYRGPTRSYGVEARYSF